MFEVGRFRLATWSKLPDSSKTSINRSASRSRKSGREDREDPRDRSQSGRLGTFAEDAIDDSSFTQAPQGVSVGDPQMTIGGGLHSVGRADDSAVALWLEPTGDNPSRVIRTKGGEPLKSEIRSVPSLSGITPTTVGLDSRPSPTDRAEEAAVAVERLSDWRCFPGRDVAVTRQRESSGLKTRPGLGGVTLLQPPLPACLAIEASDELLDRVLRTQRGQHDNEGRRTCRPAARSKDNRRQETARPCPSERRPPGFAFPRLQFRRGRSRTGGRRPNKGDSNSSSRVSAGSSAQSLGAACPTGRSARMRFFRRPREGSRSGPGRRRRIRARCGSAIGVPHSPATAADRVPRISSGDPASGGSAVGAIEKGRGPFRSRSIRRFFRDCQGDALRLGRKKEIESFAWSVRRSAVFANPSLQFVLRPAHVVAWQFQRPDGLCLTVDEGETGPHG